MFRLTARGAPEETRGVTQAAVFLALGATVLAGAVSGQYLETTLSLGGSPVAVLWNPASNKVYCADGTNDRVVVVDGATNEILASINVSSGPCALTWIPTENRVYCACADGNRVCVIDGAGDSLLTRIHTGHWPSSLVCDETDSKVYAQCWDDQELDVIDCTADTLIDVLEFGAPRVCGVWHPGTDMLFCTFPSDSAFTVDCRNDSVHATSYCPGVGTTWWPNACYNPSNQLVYYACPGIAQVRAVSTRGESTVAVIDGVYADWLGYSPSPNKLALGDFSYGRITIVDCESHTVAARLDPGGQVRGLVCDTVNDKTYVADSYNDRVLVLDLLGDTLIKTIAVGAHPVDLAWNQENSRVYVACSNGTLAVIKDVAGIEERPRRWRSGTANLLTINPNPARGTLHFGFGKRFGGSASIAVFDATGRAVWKSGPLNSAASGSDVEWYCADQAGRPVPSGVYVAQLSLQGSKEGVDYICAFTVVR